METDSIAWYQIKLRRLMEAADTIKRSVSRANAFFRTETLLGLHLNATKNTHAFNQFIGGIQDARKHVAILPHIYLNEPQPLVPSEFGDDAMSKKTKFSLDLQREFAIAETSWSFFAADLYANIPSFEATGIGRIVVFPLTIHSNRGGDHANALIVDRKYNVMTLVEPHGIPIPWVQTAIRHIVQEPTYPLGSAFTGNGFQRSLNYCATWAPYLTSEIVKVAINEDVPCDVAAMGLDRVLNNERRRIVGRHANSKAASTLDKIARLLSAAMASKILQSFAPGGAHIGSVLREVMPEIMQRSPLDIANHMLVQPKAVRSQEFKHAVFEWYHIMHSRPRCAFWRQTHKDGKGTYRLTPGFKPAILQEASSSARDIILKEILSPDSNSARKLTLRLSIRAFDLETERIADLDRWAPKIPAREAKGAYFPSAIGLAIARLLKLPDLTQAHWDVFGKGAEMAIRQNKTFLLFEQDIRGLPTHMQHVKDLATQMRQVNGSFGHRWIEGMRTKLFEEEWNRVPELPTFREFLEENQGRVARTLTLRADSVKKVLDAIAKIHADA